MESWGMASFENESASDWFLAVQEDPDPGAVIAAAIDEAVGAADELEMKPAGEAIAAAELCASCAGHRPERLPDRIEDWVQANPHGPHADEVVLMSEAVSRVRDDSDLRAFWRENNEQERWLAEVDDLLSRLSRSGAGAPPAVAP